MPWGSASCLGLFHKDSSLGSVSVSQKEIQVLLEWATSVLPSLGLSLAIPGGLSALPDSSDSSTDLWSWGPGPLFHAAQDFSLGLS